MSSLIKKQAGQTQEEIIALVDDVYVNEAGDIMQGVLDLSEFEPSNLVFETLAGDPASSTEGRGYWNTVTKELLIYDGSSYVGPSVIHGVDQNAILPLNLDTTSDTGWRSDSGDEHVSLFITGTERQRVSSTTNRQGYIAIAAAAATAYDPLFALHVRDGGTATQVVIEPDTSGTSVLRLRSYNAVATNYSAVVARRGRGTRAAQSNCVVGDSIFGIECYGESSTGDHFGNLKVAAATDLRGTDWNFRTTGLHLDSTLTLLSTGDVVVPTGNLGVGRTSTGKLLEVYSSSGQSAIEVESENSESHLNLVTHGGATDGSEFGLRKHRGTLTSPTIVFDDDDIGRIRFMGYDGSTLKEAARIESFVDDTPGLSDMPGRLVMKTTPNGSATPLERLRINNGGRIAIAAGGATAFDPVSELHVRGPGVTVEFAIEPDSTGRADVIQRSYHTSAYNNHEHYRSRGTRTVQTDCVAGDGIVDIGFNGKSTHASNHSGLIQALCSADGTNMTDIGFYTDSRGGTTKILNLRGNGDVEMNRGYLAISPENVPFTPLHPIHVLSDVPSMRLEAATSQSCGIFMTSYRAVPQNTIQSSASRGTRAVPLNLVAGDPILDICVNGRSTHASNHGGCLRTIASADGTSQSDWTMYTDHVSFGKKVMTWRGNGDVELGVGDIVSVGDRKMDIVLNKALDTPGDIGMIIRSTDSSLALNSFVTQFKSASGDPYLSIGKGQESVDGITVGEIAHTSFRGGTITCNGDPVAQGVIAQNRAVAGSTGCTSHNMNRARGTLDAPSTVLIGDFLGCINFTAHNGTSMPGCAAIYGRVDDTGTVSGTSMPGRVEIWTAPDGTNVPIERLSVLEDGTTRFAGDIDHDGTNFGIYSTTPAPQPAAYTIINPVALRSLDVTTGTLSDVKKVLGTLIADIKTWGGVG